MVDIFPGVNPPTYFTQFDWRPLHVYILHEKGNAHLQLKYVEFSTYQQACISIKAHWKQLFNEEYGTTPIILTTNAGAVVHHDNWTSFTTTRSPCLAWYGSGSMELLLDELRKKKEILNKHLEQLRATETVVYYAEGRPANQISVEWCPCSTVVVGEAGEEPKEWDLLEHVAALEYAVAAGRVEEPGLVNGGFDQGGAETAPPA